MNHYYTLSEKYAYIDADFKQSKLYNMGKLDEAADMREYFHKAIEYAGEFMDKYHDRGKASSEYANAIVNDWMDTLERIAKQKHEEAK